MKYVELVDGSRSSVLGFGCAPVMGAVDRRTAEKAVSSAIDLGITHFDVAPSYGFGEAEEALGAFIQGRRDGLVLATKFGIEARPIARVARPLKSALRLLRRYRSPGGKTASPAATGAISLAGRLHRRVPLTGASLTRSFERSLKRLRTDRIDLLFLHDPADDVENFGEILEAAVALKSAGKLRGFGMALMSESVALHRRWFSSLDVLQVQVPDEPAALEGLRTERADARNVLFAPFRAARQGGSLASCSAPGSALSLLHDRFPNSVLLCSMFSVEHLRSNALILQ